MFKKTLIGIVVGVLCAGAAFAQTPISELWKKSGVKLLAAKGATQICLANGTSCAVLGSASGLALGDLSDVNTMEVGTGYIISYTGTGWVSTANSHNSTSSLQGGKASEYYHLTSAQSSAVNNTAINWVVVDPNTALPALGDGKAYFRTPDKLNGMNITGIFCHVYTASGGGTAVNVSLYNVTDSADVLSTQLTIDNSETDSSTAATPPVIDTAHDEMATGDVFRWDLNQIGSGTKGLECGIKAQLP